MKVAGEDVRDEEVEEVPDACQKAKASGYSCSQVKAAGWSCEQAKLAGYSCAEVKEAGEDEEEWW